MNQGMKAIIYPVKDITLAKKALQQPLGCKARYGRAYYVGFHVLHRAKVLTVEGERGLQVEGLEAIDGTPIIDIKPILGRGVFRTKADHPQVGRSQIPRGPVRDA